MPQWTKTVDVFPEGDPVSVTRVDPPYVADEREMLESWLDFHRDTLEIKCDGLTTDDLRRRAVPPSNLSLLGLVRHMAEVERGWFRGTVAGEQVPAIYCTEAQPDADFDAIEDADPQEAFATWRSECEEAREITTATPSLDTTGIHPRSQEAISLRWILVHMIEEYARHNGHADFLRECIDGTVGD
ncbi:MAG: DinB family protein [Chloroflexota bacterium]